MRISSFGCSFIAGTDLQDFGSYGEQNFLHSRCTYPALIAQRLGIDYDCYARGASGNMFILHKILTHATADDLVIVNWSYIDRFDYVDLEKIESWRTILPSDDTGSKIMIKENPRSGGVSSHEFYFRKIHSTFRDQVQSLSCIVTAIEYLKQIGAPFLMTFQDSTMMTTERSRYHRPETLDHLQDMVDPYLQTFDGMDFVSWSRHCGFPFRGSHPAEEAHVAAADYWQDYMAGLYQTKNSRS